jgi:hypothetical protein
MTSDSGMVAGFSASEFAREEFEAQEFVAMARRSVPLDELVKDLSAHLAELKMNLVDAINTDYAAFVGMASSLKGLDKALSRVRTPVEALRSEVQQIRDAAAAAAEQFDSKLDERQLLLKTERKLTLLLDIEQGIQKLEVLLEKSNKQIATGNELGSSENVAFALGLERIGHELARLKGQIHRLEDENNLAVRKDLIARIEFIEENLISKINAIFSFLVQFSDKDGNGSESKTTCRYLSKRTILDHIMRIFYTLNRPDACETVVKQFAVEPFLAHKLTVSALEAGITGSCSGLSQFFDAVLGFVDEYCLPLASVATTALDSDFEIESDLEEVYELLNSSQTISDNRKDSMGSNSGTWILTDPSFYIRSCLFPPLSAALLNVGGRRLTQYLDKGFQNKYNCTMEFLNKLEIRCGSREGALALRSQPAFVDFIHKWDLPLRAFFQLRFQEITDQVGPLLTTPAMLQQCLEEEAAAAAKAAAAAAAAAAVSPGAGNTNPSIEALAQPAPSQAPPLALRMPLPMAVEASPDGEDGELSLEASAVVWKALLGVWGDGLPALVQRGLQLSLLLVERYLVWAREWSDYLGKRLASSSADRDSDASAGPRRADDELRLVAMIAKDCQVLARRAAGELGAAVETALVHVLMSEASAQPSVQLVRSAIADSCGACTCASPRLGRPGCAKSHTKTECSPASCRVSG